MKSLVFRSVLVFFAFLFSMSTNAQTSIVEGDGVRYEVDNQQGAVFLKEGESRVSKSASCTKLEKDSFFYLKQTCTSEKIITVSKGILTESGGEITVGKVARQKVIALLVGMIFMLAATALFTFSPIAAAFLAFLAAVFALMALPATLAAESVLLAAATNAVIAFVSALKNKGKKDIHIFFISAIIYEFFLLFVLNVVV